MLKEDLLEKERQVEVSRLKHAILEYELKLIKKLDEVERVKIDLEKAKKRLEEKEG
jgi:hypothetical protein